MEKEILNELKKQSKELEKQTKMLNYLFQINTKLSLKIHTLDLTLRRMMNKKNKEKESDKIDTKS